MQITSTLVLGCESFFLLSSVKLLVLCVSAPCIHLSDLSLSLSAATQDEPVNIEEGEEEDYGLIDAPEGVALEGASLAQPYDRCFL